MKKMNKYSAYIGNLTVSSKSSIIVYGSAEKSLARDQAGCRSQGGYSDASVYQWSDSDGWTRVNAH